MIKRKCKLIQTICLFGKNKVLPTLLVVKNVVCKVFQFCLKIMRLLFLLSVFSVFAVVPFLHNQMNHFLAQCLWYPACAIFLIVSIKGLKKDKTILWGDSRLDLVGIWGWYSLIPLFLSIFVFNYYSIDYYWKWVIFVLIFVATPFFLFLLYYADSKVVDRTEDERRTGALNIFKQTLLYWLYDLLYMSIFNDWTMLMYILGVITVIVMFYNLTSVFLKGNKTIQFLLPFELLLGLGLSIYLIYTIPDPGLQEIVLTIAASVLGGLLALVGVAWTIRDGNTKRQEDFQRLENERREEERKKHIPYIRIAFEREAPPMVADACITTGLDLQKQKDRDLLHGNTFFSVNVENFKIKNLSSGNIILQGVIFHGKFYKFSRLVVVEPGANCQINTTNNWHVSVAYPEQSISLIASDVLGNQYQLTCNVTHKFDSRLFSIQTEINGETFTGLDYTYVITSVDLPNLINPEDN